MSYTKVYTNRGVPVLLDWHDAPKIEGRSVYLDGKGYPSIWVDGKNLRLHRFILRVPDHVEVDHVNHDVLDARRHNLRTCTRSENMRNRGIRATNTSGYKGVSFHKLTGRWRAYLVVDRKQIYLGLFDSPVDAARAHDEAAREHHKEYAYLNFPQEVQHASA